MKNNRTHRVFSSRRSIILEEKVNMRLITLLVGFALFVAIVIPTITAESLTSADAETDADTNAYAEAEAEAVADAIAEAFNWDKVKEKLHDIAVKVTDWARKKLEKESK